MQTQTIIKRFMTEELLNGSPEAEPDPDDSLIDAGILDSVRVLKLLLFIEEQFQLTIADSEVTPANFETLNRITAFINGKTEGQP